MDFGLSVRNLIRPTVRMLFCSRDLRTTVRVCSKFSNFLDPGPETSRSWNRSVLVHGFLLCSSFSGLKIYFIKKIVDEAKRRNLELVKIGRTFSNTSDHVHKIMKILIKRPLLALNLKKRRYVALG